MKPTIASAKAAPSPLRIALDGVVRAKCALPLLPWRRLAVAR